MSAENPTAPSMKNQQIGFIGAPELPPLPKDSCYPPNNLPYPSNNNLPYPISNQPYPPVYQQHHPVNGPSSINHAPNTAYPPIHEHVHTTQPGPNTIIIQEQKLSSEPITTTCPNCKELVTTSVKYKSGERTHAAALLLCALDQDCCAILPYCCDKAKDAHHSCPKCGHYFGKHKPSL